MEPDPTGLEAGLNPYSYASNNPVNNVDPSRLSDFNFNFSGMNLGASLPSLPDPIYQAAMGFSNSISFGLSQPISNFVNGYQTANVNSGAYSAGGYAAMIAPGGLLGGGLERGVASAGGKYTVGAYNEIKGTVLGLDAHHVGQKAVMKDLIPGYNPVTEPSILVPKVGHTIKEPNGILSRSTEGLTTPRDVLARDIWELRRVYPDVPNSQLQKPIKMNKDTYPGSF